MRLPTRRPCMSGKAMMTVSISPLPTAACRSLNVSMPVMTPSDSVTSSKQSRGDFVPARIYCKWDSPSVVLADRLFLFRDHRLTPGDDVAHRRALEPPLLEAEPDDRGQHEEADNDVGRLVVWRLDAEDDDQDHRQHRKDSEQQEYAAPEIPRAHFVPLRRPPGDGAQNDREGERQEQEDDRARHDDGVGRSSGDRYQRGTEDEEHRQYRC